MKDIDTIAAQKPAEDSSSKLCLEVVEDSWAKKTGGRAADFEAAVRTQLKAPTESHEQVGKLFVQALEEREVQRHGESAGKQIFENAKAIWKCK